MLAERGRTSFAPLLAAALLGGLVAIYAQQWLERPRIVSGPRVPTSRSACCVARAPRFVGGMETGAGATEIVAVAELSTGFASSSRNSARDRASW